MSSTLDSKEDKRIRLQSEVDSTKSKEERNRMGQFATPTVLAQDIAEYILEGDILKDQQIDFLDPALGTGSFFSSLMRQLEGGRLNRAVGVEIDEDYANIARELWEDYGLEVILGDFTRLKPPTARERLANLVLTNPPYVRHHHIGKNEKSRLRRLVKKRTGYEINGLSGLYCYFLLLSHSWLRENGYGVWLIPSEFMDVNYGATLKEYLTQKVRLIRIHRFHPEDVQFDDALVSSAIVIFRKEKPKGSDTVEFSSGGSLRRPALSRLVRIDDLLHIRKWRLIPATKPPSGMVLNHKKPRLRDFFKIQRGIATGANNFFIMPKSKAMSMEIPKEFLKPILPSPRNLRVDTVEPDEMGYPELPEQLVVFDCDLPENVLRIDNDEFQEYLGRGKSMGIRDRYLVKKRHPWYKQEFREPAPFLCTYMGRVSKNRTPFRFIWNRSKAICTNVYLMLYPIGELAKVLDQDPSGYPLVFGILGKISAKEMMEKGRVYGGGLYKVEPNELGEISAKEFAEFLELYSER